MQALLPRGLKVVFVHFTVSVHACCSEQLLLESCALHKLAAVRIGTLREGRQVHKAEEVTEQTAPSLLRIF